MTPRIPCCVPFCRRTTGQRYTEWCCGPHWRLGSGTLRRRKARVRRRIASLYRRGGMHSAQWARLIRLHNAIWERIKAQIIERAAGISG